jgi:hypothetical protein
MQNFGAGDARFRCYIQLSTAALILDFTLVIAMYQSLFSTCAKVVLALALAYSCSGYSACLQRDDMPLFFQNSRNNHFSHFVPE